MYGVVMHDYMRDMLSEEFTMAYGETKRKATENAWEKLKSELDDDMLKDLEFDNGDHVTKTSFIKRIIDNADSEDAELISEPYYLYVKLFKIGTIL